MLMPTLITENGQPVSIQVWGFKSFVNVIPAGMDEIARYNPAKDGGELITTARTAEEVIALRKKYRSHALNPRKGRFLDFLYRAPSGKMYGHVEPETGRLLLNNPDEEPA